MRPIPSLGAMGPGPGHLGKFFSARRRRRRRRRPWRHRGLPRIRHRGLHGINPLFHGINPLFHGINPLFHGINPLGLGIGGFLGLGIGGNFNLPNMVALNKPTSKLDKFVLTLMGNLKSLEP